MGGREDFREITWIKWVCSKTKLLDQMGYNLHEKEFGGLGFRRIRGFNVALLEKWCWMLREERDRLWY